MLMRKCLECVNDGEKRVVVSFVASTKRLIEKEIRGMDKGKDLSYIRGNVECRSNDGKVYYSERNVSFGRYEREVISKIDACHNYPSEIGFRYGGFDEVFPSF